MDLPAGHQVVVRKRKRERTEFVSKKPKACAKFSVFTLPTDLQHIICTYLKYNDLFFFEKVSSQACNVVNHKVLWEVVDVKHLKSEFNTPVQVTRFISWVASTKGNFIRNLRLAKSAVATGALNSIAKYCTSLQEVDLSGCKQLSDEVVNRIVDSNSALKVFKAAQCPQLTDVSLNSLGRKSNKLLEVSFAHCRLITSSGVLSLVREANKLKTVGLKGCPKVDNLALMFIADSCPNLLNLSIGGGGELGDSGLKAIGSKCTNLENLDISSSNPFRGNRSVSDDGITSLLTKCQGIKSLSLKGCSRLSPVVLKAIVENCPKIKILDVGGCKGIAQFEDVLGSFLSQLSHLEELSLWSCPVTDDTVIAVAQSCRKLNKLDVDGCQVTNVSAEYFENQSTKCFIRGIKPASPVPV